jgi:large-conductance mechanosensitive channel
MPSIISAFANLNPATKIMNKFGNQRHNRPETFGAIGAYVFDETSATNELLNFVILAFALYLAFKCKKDGKINFVQLIIALCCSPCYVVYRLVKPCDKF